MMPMAATSRGKALSRIGLGCARLSGGTERKSAVRVIETAIECGITHFDTAPSYGFGLSEELLGSVLADAGQFTVTTKVGMPRPAHGGRLAVARRILRPIVQKSALLKRLAARAVSSQKPRPPIDAATIRASL